MKHTERITLYRLSGPAPRWRLWRRVILLLGVGVIGFSLLFYLLGGK